MARNSHSSGIRNNVGYRRLSLRLPAGSTSPGLQGTVQVPAYHLKAPLPKTLEEAAQKDRLEKAQHPRPRDGRALRLHRGERHEI